MIVHSPGFFDLQVNGFAGVDFNDPAVTPDDVRRAADALLDTGVTRFLATLITAPLDDFSRCARAVLEANHPSVAGLHMEGPYINPNDGPRGAHRRAYVLPALLGDFLRRQDAAGGCVRLVTLAPEAPGALPLIEALVRTGIRVAIGHSAATPEQVRDAIRAGVTLSTHLGNGCANLLPRHPNLVWEQLAADEMTACLIVDGHHLPPATVKAMIRAKTPARTVLVTDAIAAAGRPPGRYVLGGVTVELDRAGRVTEPGAGHFAGSALRMNAAVANTVRFAGVPVGEALAMASTRPAAAVGLPTRGRIIADWNPDAFSLCIRSVNTETAA
jgi:N-acetylglucosamine-6-phosphate deacetylase